MLPLTIIVAATRNNGIGQGSRLPWRLQEEMAYFAKITKHAPSGHINALIMGRKTWESIPKKNRPLIGRVNIVITSNPDYKLEPVKENSPSVVENGLDSALARLTDETLAGDNKKLGHFFIIGGASIYKDTLALEPKTLTSPIVNRILLTRILSPDFADCDVFFPEFEKDGEWSRASHDELQKWAGFEVARGIQEENGVQYEFQMWLGAVILATIGVIIDVYGGSSSGGRGESLDSSPIPNGGTMNHEASLPSTAPLAGDLLTLIASLAYALYQVLYKRYAALPSDDIAEFHIPQSRPTLSRTHSSYQSLCNNPLPPSPIESSTYLFSERHIKDDDNDGDDEYSDLPFGLYPNFLTSCLGLSTAVLLGFGIPLLHWTSLERFQLPPDTHTALCIGGIALTGLIFNASFMILLGIWGPILTSVGNLLTIVLVIIADFFFNHGAVSIWSLIGAAMIASGFAILALDMIQLKQS
ncbi:hypothetical protein Clacol_008032 [Clathrus columnatus]|uniref:Dihydrofolate reductase n=1 Tax=Clathrus columnatus TaxID=1419009 RepID=A0AAV5ALP0_9AGAM|nr:hypothetical protein Clacol_008032 [Clathrus columnatus]